MNTYRLWVGDAPGALGTAEADIPTLTDYGQPGSTAKAACVVCPGGAYAGLADYEGHPVAEWLETIGIRGFVLKYRLGPRYHHPVMLHDAERAVRYVRANAASLGVDVQRVGIMGFSAGGHLASTLSTHSSSGVIHPDDPIDGFPSHPDFSVLLYPVVSMMDPYAHAYSREMLLGKNPSLHVLEELSNALSVSLTTPPTFICHGANDQVVPVQNSLQYAMALADHKRPFEIYMPQNGPHGFGLGKPGSEQDWTGLCAKWLQSRGLTQTG